MTLNLPELPESYKWHVEVHDRTTTQKDLDRNHVYPVAKIDIALFGPDSYKGGYVAGTVIEVPLDIKDAQLEYRIEQAATKLLRTNGDKVIQTYDLKKRVARLMEGTA